MNYTDNDIIDFIFRRWRKPFPNAADIWNNGNCYWFVHILTSVFPHLQIYYNPVEGHFIAGNGETFYDINGYYKSENQDKYILFEDIKEEDPSWYRRLTEDCIL